MAEPATFQLSSFVAIPDLFFFFLFVKKKKQHLLSTSGNSIEHFAISLLFFSASAKAGL